MAFSKVASAVVVSPIISWKDWSKISPDTFRNRCAKEGIISKYDPREYCLSHCTIIASVDVEDSQDYYITPATARFVNNNWDAWERKLLLSTYHTFKGARNFVEHVQLEEQAKGYVIDAVAREVVFPGKTAGEGDAKSIYVDILVATDRKHKELVKKIESGETNKLSMGCVVLFTLCSKCGNRAEDAVQLCSHIKYEKGNKFIDEQGVERIIAELCGHYTEPDSVKFIDASWVKNPAFEGAVSHKIIAPSFELKDKIKASAEIQPLIGTEGLRLKKVAGTHQYILAQGEEEAPAEEAPAEKPKLKDVKKEAPKEEVPAEEAPAEESPKEEVPAEEESIEEVATPEKLEKEVSFSDLKEIIKKELKEKAKQEAKNELLKEMTDEFTNTAAPPKFVEDEQHLRETLISSNDKSLEKFISADAKKSFREFESYEYNQLKMINLEEIESAFGKKFSPKIVEALNHLYHGHSWKTLPLTAKESVLLSAFIASKVTPKRYDKRLYKLVLKAKDYSNKSLFIQACEKELGHKLTSEELQKLSREIKRYLLLEQKSSRM